MGNRLSKIYTRTGDAGTTGLGDGSRVDKDDPRVEAMGDVDELNSVIGLLLTEPLPDGVGERLVAVQHSLFDLGGELAVPGFHLVDGERAAELERYLDSLNAELSPLKEFILPGGSRAAAVCHLARAVCRRAERRLHALSRIAAVTDESRRYLNRLSDLLFVLARTLNHAEGNPDVLWHNENRALK
jgi:cob(I)alamin adenosyltransferase